MPKGKKARYAYYAVAKGKRGPGVYATWKETEQHTRKVSGAKHQGCDTLDEVRQFFEEHKVDMALVSWGEGTRLPGDPAPFSPPPTGQHVLAQPASQGVAVAVALYASGSQSSSQSSGLAEAASAAMARAVEVLGRSSSPAESLGADKELPPLPPSSQPSQECDTEDARDVSEPPTVKEKEKAALLRVRNQVEVALTALCSPNGDGTTAPEVPNAAFAETMRNILKDIDDGLRTGMLSSVLAAVSCLSCRPTNWGRRPAPANRVNLWTKNVLL